MTRELHRQAAHLAGGLAAAFAAAFLEQKTFLLLFGLCAVLGTLFIIFTPKLYKRFFGQLERESSAFAGKGAVFFGLGIFFTALLFWKHAIPAILILAVPDAAATVLGAAFTSPKLPYNRRKSSLGSAAFFVATSLLLSISYQELAIFFIAFLLTALESFDYREIPFLDDNLVVPVVAAYLLTFL